MTGGSAWEVGDILGDGVEGQRKTRGEAMDIGVGESTVRISWYVSL